MGRERDPDVQSQICLSSSSHPTTPEPNLKPSRATSAKSTHATPGDKCASNTAEPPGAKRAQNTAAQRHCCKNIQNTAALSGDKLGGAPSDGTIVQNTSVASGGNCKQFDRISTSQPADTFFHRRGSQGKCPVQLRPATKGDTCVHRDPDPCSSNSTKVGTRTETRAASCGV